MVGGTRTPEEQRGGTLRSIRGFAPRAPSRQLPREQKRARLNLPTTVVQPEEWLALSLVQTPLLFRDDAVIAAGYFQAV